MGTCASRHTVPDWGSELIDYVNSLGSSRDACNEEITHEVARIQQDMDFLSLENDILKERVSQLEHEDEWSRMDILVKHYAAAASRGRSKEKKRRSVGFSVPINMMTAACTPEPN
jgi:hypothetical protein